METIKVKAFWDEEALVWVAESDDVPGLATEAETFEKLVEKLRIMVPELLSLNELSNQKEKELEIPLIISSQRTEKIKLAA